MDLRGKCQRLKKKKSEKTLPLADSSLTRGGAGLSAIWSAAMFCYPSPSPSPVGRTGPGWQIAATPSTAADPGTRSPIACGQRSSSNSVSVCGLSFDLPELVFTAAIVTLLIPAAACFKIFSYLNTLF